jgi:hypothetical protein
MDLKKQVATYREDLDRKAQRIKDLEKQNLNNKATFEQEIESLTTNMGRKIKTLEQENTNLRKQELLNKDKVASNTMSSFPKSSAFLTEAKVDKRDGNNLTGIKDSEELKAKMKNLEGIFLIIVEEKDAEIEKSKNLEKEFEEKINAYKELESKVSEYEDENANLKEEIEKLEKEFNEEKQKWEKLEQEYKEKVEDIEKERDIHEDRLVEYQKKFEKANIEITLLKEQQKAEEKNDEKNKKKVGDIPQVNEKKKQKEAEIVKSQGKEDGNKKQKSKQPQDEKIPQVVEDLVKKPSLSNLKEETTPKTKQVKNEQPSEETAKYKDKPIATSDAKGKELYKEKQKNEIEDKTKKPVKSFDSEKKFKTENENHKVTINNSKENYEEDYGFDDYKEDEESYDRLPDKFPATGFGGGFKPRNDDDDE